jgi:hypothetical protein
MHSPEVIRLSTRKSTSQLQICATLGKLLIVSKQLYAKNKKELARLIGISHTSLLRLFQRSDHPENVLGKGWLIEQWHRYAHANIRYEKQRKSIVNNTIASPNLRDEAYIARQEVAAERERFELDVKRGRYELKTAMIERVMTNFGFFVRELEKALRHELPPRLEGLSAGQIAKLLGQKLDDLRERAARAMEDRNGSEPTLA